MSTTQTVIIEVLERCLEDEEHEETQAGLAAHKSQDECEYLEHLNNAQVSALNRVTLQSLLCKVKGP